MLRGIDKERGLYFLLTPVDPSILRNVNCLLLGAISLPSCILTSQVRMQTFVKCFVFFRTESERRLSFSLGLMERPRTWPQTTVLTSAGQESCGFSRDWLDLVMWGHTELFYGLSCYWPSHFMAGVYWRTRHHQRFILMFSRCLKAPSHVHPGRSLANREFPHIWPFSDVTHSRRFCGILTVVGFCPQAAERFSIWMCWQTSPPHVSTLKMSWPTLQCL